MGSMIEANPQLKEVFANPTIAYDHKRKVLEELIARTSRARNDGELSPRVVKKSAPLAVGRRGRSVRPCPRRAWRRSFGRRHHRETDSLKNSKTIARNPGGCDRTNACV